MLRLPSRLLTALCLGVFLSAFPACDSDDLDDSVDQTIVEIAQDSPDLSILVQALQEAGLVSTLQGDGPFTVFAPDDAAFEALLADLGVTAEELLARDDLDEILTYHVVQTAAFSADLEDGDVLTTVEGGTLEVDINGEVISLIGETNTVRVTTADIAASNGVVHIIDGVLLPDLGLLANAIANLGEWFFIETEGARCRDGSATGFGVRLQESAENLMIYLEGGGACFNDVTCAQNRDNYGPENFDDFVTEGGNVAVFSTDEGNPVGDWNAVYVPYCTGDVHGGSAPDATVPGVAGTQQFVGHQNVERYLDLVEPVVGDPDKVLLTGSSAGGFGSLVNFAQVADRFEASERYLVDDSGPIFFADDVLSPQLAGQFSALYNFPASFPSDASVLFEADGLQNVYDYYDERYPDATFGLSSYLEDQTIRFFFGFGQPDGTISGPEYAAGLEGIEAMAPESWGTYYAVGTDHTFLRFPDRYFGSVDGTVYADWLGAILDGNANDVAPTPTRIAGK
jgi:uncharacterized surface protein with fasciclin (FAS1) repeats